MIVFPARPRVYCFVARVTAAGDLAGPVIRIALNELALTLRRDGYAIVGPDPIDMHDVTMWDRQFGHQ